MPGASGDETRVEAPKGWIEKVGAALPIGLTALATVFAGMSTGALQQAMFWRRRCGTGSGQGDEPVDPRGVQTRPLTDGRDYCRPVTGRVGL